ncbi:MAG: hypothetical protein SGPRY_000677 [Prymnesium sp.]
MRPCFLLSLDAVSESTSAFIWLASDLNATLYAVQSKRSTPASTCPHGARCMPEQHVTKTLQLDGCRTVVTHDWRSPLHALLADRRDMAMGTELSDSGKPRALLLITRFGGEPFDVSYRSDIILYGIDHYIDRAMELATMRAADAVIFPSEWMRNGAERGAVDRISLHEPRLRRVQSFAYVGPLNDRHGVGIALRAVCHLQTTLHIFGANHKPSTLRNDGEALANLMRRALPAGGRNCSAKFRMYGEVQDERLYKFLTTRNVCLLLPSLLESHSFRAIELSKHGLPEVVMNADATLAPLDDFEMRVSSIWRTGFHTQMTFSSARNSWGQLLESSQSRKLSGITAKESEMVSVQRSLVLGADRDSWKGNSTYADLLHLLEGQEEGLVQLLPSPEFVTKQSPIIVDALAADFFAPAIDVSGSALTKDVPLKHLRVLPPFLVGQLPADSRFFAFPNGIK